MDIIRIDRLPVSPWKNKGGTTRTLAVWPPDAAVDAEDWRVAVSDIGRPGPFSPYPGFDRLLLPLGAGLRLGFDGAEPRPVPIFEAIAFDGGIPTTCALDANAAAAGLQVVNLLLRRGRQSGRLQAHPGAGRVHGAGGAAVLLTARGGFHLVRDNERPIALDAGHAIVQLASDATVAFEPYRPWSMLIAAVVQPA